MLIGWLGRWPVIVKATGERHALVWDEGDNDNKAKEEVANGGDGYLISLQSKGLFLGSVTGGRLLLQRLSGKTPGDILTDFMTS